MKGIIFRGDHVLRILDGRKTQTRRLLKPAPAYPDSWNDIVWSFEDGLMPGTRTGASLPCITRKPRYIPGETLYCKETWLRFDMDHVIGGKKYAYRADATHDGECARKSYGYKWKSAMMMPEWASRCHIKITEIRVQRLQEISEEDAESEGAPLVDEVSGRESLDKTRGSYRLGFRAMWDSINPKHPWANNEWVWVYGLEKV